MLNKITSFLTHAATLYTLIIGIIGSIITIFVTYQNFMNAIKTNQEQIEITQIMILKPLVRFAEHNPCPVSDAEWDEYIVNAATLHELKKKHKLISKDMLFTPIERIKERSDKCQK